MDLSEGSDAEDGTQVVTQYVNEDDLLEGSDDEEPAKDGRQSMPRSTGGMNDEEDLLYSDDEDEFLDLRAGDEDDELGLGNESLPVGITPLKVPVRTAVAEDESNVVARETEPTTSVAPTEEFESHGEGESQLEEPNPEKMEDANEDDDEDEDEDKTQRSRFHSERKPVTVSGNSGNSSMGKPQPIRSLGYHNVRGNMHHQNQQGQRNWGSQNGPRQFHRGFNNHNHRGQRPQQHMMMPPHMQMQHNGLLGPRPEMNQLQQGPGPRGFAPPPGLPCHQSDSAPVVQFSSEIFTDFNTPVRPPGPNSNRPNLQNQLPPQGQGTQIPTVQVNPVARPGVGIVRPQPVVNNNNNPNKNPGSNANKPVQAQNPPQQLRPRIQAQNNPFFPSPSNQNQGPRNNTPGSRPAWKGNLRPPRPQNNSNQINNNNIRAPQQPQFPGPRPPNAFDQPGNNAGPRPNPFCPPSGNNVHIPMQNLQPPGAETGPVMNNGPPQGFGGPNIRQPIQQGPPQPLINPNPFLQQRHNRPFMGPPQGMSVSVMQQHGQMPVQMQLRNPFDNFPAQNAPRLMGHTYPPDPEFRNQPPIGQRHQGQGPEMYNMAPPTQQQFGPRFGGLQEPMFNPNQPNIRHQFFGEPQHQQPFHPDPGMMNFMQGPQGGFPQHPQQFQQQMLPMNNMSHGVQALSLNSFPNQYPYGGIQQQGYHPMDHHHEFEERYGVKLPSKRKKDNKTLSEEFIALTNPGKQQRLYDRLGPPPARKTEVYNQDQADEIVKIIVETKKEMGIDDDYMKQIEEQKRKRAEILRIKAERWKTAKDDDSGTRPKQSRQEDSRSVPQQAITRTISNLDATGPETRKSIYINPAAFKGDLSVLNNNLRRINMSISSDSMSQSAASHTQASSHVAAPTSTVSGSQARSSTASGGRTLITSPRESSPKVRPSKRPKTILRVTKNKKGEIIHMEKLLKVEKTTSVHTQHK